MIELTASIETLVELDASIDAEVSITLPYITVDVQAVPVPRYCFVTADGRLADATSQEYGDAHAVGVQSLLGPSAPANEPVNVAYEGNITNPAWAFNVGFPVFLSANGTVTQEVPSAANGHVWNVLLGVPAGTTSLVLDIRQPVKLRM